MFGSKNKQQKTATPDLSQKLFPISTPYGYNPEDVEKAIREFQETVSKQQEYIHKLKESIIIQKERNEKLEQELRNVQFQLNFASVPSVNEIQEEYIKERFDKQFNNNEKEEEIKETKKIKVSNIPKKTTNDDDDSGTFSIEDLLN